MWVGRGGGVGAGGGRGWSEGRTGLKLALWDPNPGPQLP